MTYIQLSSRAGSEALSLVRGSSVAGLRRLVGEENGDGLPGHQQLLSGLAF